MKKEWSTRHLFLSQPKRRTYISSECQALKILWDQAVKFHTTAQKRCLDATTWVGPFRFSPTTPTHISCWSQFPNFHFPARTRPRCRQISGNCSDTGLSFTVPILWLFWDPHFSSFSLVTRCPQWCLNPTMPTDGWEGTVLFTGLGPSVEADRHRTTCPYHALQTIHLSTF